MASSIRAQINPDLLIWARESCRMDTEYAANKLRITREKLESWELGETQLTINQLRELAKTYRVNFGALFLPIRPKSFKPPVKDFRLHHGVQRNDINPEITIDLRLNLNTREIALELENDLGDQSPFFQLSCSIEEQPTEVATRIRKALGITFDKQKKFRESRVAFTEW